MKKKPYEKPILKSHGELRKVTKYSGPLIPIQNPPVPGCD